MEVNMFNKIQRFLPREAPNFLHSLITRVEKLLRVGDGRGIVWIIIGLGIVLRLIPYFHNPSLWLDEAALALNILHKPFSQLVGPLDYQQMAPVGFLIMEKILVLTFGDSEYALRFFPLLAGILSLFLFYGVARRILTLRGLTIAIGLFAISEPLFRYSSVLKQYSSDVTIALGIYLLGLICIEKESRFVLSLFLFSIAGAILIWFSHPAIFSLAGVGIALTLYCLKTKKWQHVAWLSLPACFWLGSFAFNYFITYLDLSQNPTMVKAWSGSTVFMPMLPLSVQDLIWFPKTFLAMFIQTAGLSFYGLAAFCFVVGWVSMFWEKRYAFHLLTFPFMFTLFASGVAGYPFHDRLILFLVPAILIFISNGVDRIMTMAKPTGPMVSVSLCVLLFFLPVYIAMSNLLNPTRMEREEIRPVMAYLSQYYQEGDKLYLSQLSFLAFEYYAKRFGLEKVTYQLGVLSQNNWDKHVNDLRSLRGNDRVWILFSHVQKNSRLNEEKFALFVLNSMGTQVESFKRTGASVYLYELPSNSTQ